MKLGERGERVTYIVVQVVEVPAVGALAGAQAALRAARGGRGRRVRDVTRARAEAAARQAHGPRRAPHAVVQVQAAQRRVRAVVAAAQERRARAHRTPHASARSPAMAFSTVLRKYT